VTVDSYFFGLIRKLLSRKLYHEIMYCSLPKVFRWGEDEHYFMDTEYERREPEKELTEQKFPLPDPNSIRRPSKSERSGKNDLTILNGMGSFHSNKGA
jgi:hypothetical protein